MTLSRVRRQVLMRNGANSFVLIGILSAIGVLSGIGFARWSGDPVDRSVNYANASVLTDGGTPTIHPSGSTATIAWPAATLTSGVNASGIGYIVKRYDTNDVAQTVNTGCSGTISTLSCTEIDVPDGTWAYTITPTLERWTGVEGPKVSAYVGTSALAITTASTTVTAGSESVVFHLQRQDVGGVATTEGDLSVSLGASAPTGSFLPAPVLTILDGTSEVTFTYTDTHADSVDLAATAGPFTANQTIIVMPADPQALSFSTQPSSITAGQSFASHPVVEIDDAYGNHVTTATNDVSLAISGGSGPSGATLTCDSNTVGAASGSSTFGNCLITKAGTGYTLTADSVGLTSATSLSFDVAAGSPAQLAFGAQPSNATAGQSISPSVEVRIEDAYGNLTSATDSVSVAIGTGPGGALLSGTSTVAAVNGLATFSDLSTTKAGSGFSLNASMSGLAPVASDSFVVSPDIDAKLAFVAEPSDSVAGVVLPTTVGVEVRDQFDNKTLSTSPVTLHLGTNAVGGVLDGDVTAVAVNGRANFANIKVVKAGDFTLTATSPALSDATSVPFTIVPGPAAVLSIAQQPTTVTSSTAISPAVVVEIHDSYANVVTSSTSHVSLAIGANPGGGTLAGTAATDAVNGVATFAGLSIDKAGVGYTLVADSSGLTAATSVPFSVVVGAASKLQFVAPPTNTLANIAFVPAVVVRVLDAGGNLVTTSSAVVSLAIGSNPSSGSLTGTSSTAVNGVAAFAASSINTAGVGYTLTASSSGLTGAVSPSFTIT